MSKIGRLPIPIPDGVTISVDAGQVNVKGPKGELTHTLPAGITVELKDKELIVVRRNDTKQARALHGLTRALLANFVHGVTQEYGKTLELVGTGYRVRLQGNKLILSLGFSHEVTFEVPSGIQAQVEGTNLIHLKGVSKHEVGQAAAVIREFRPPEPYKGKGIKYLNEVIRRKAGKAAKTASA